MTIDWGSKPVIIVGNGARGANTDALLQLGIPILCSWQAIDLFDSSHPLVFGRTGLYGQRCANKILYNADFVLAIGCRMSIWQVGYGDKSFAPNARIQIVDIDEGERKKVNIWQSYEFTVMDAGLFISGLTAPSDDISPWISQCSYWRKIYPWVEAAHNDTAFINSYRFMERLNTLFTEDQIVTADCGGACCSAFQVLKIKPPQKMMSSGGLGEMGCGIPAAIGASFATNKGQVICLVGDGGAMLNLQELQTIFHHGLPIKIFVFNNDGYGMIKWTQKYASYEKVATDQISGVSCPDYRRLAMAFGIDAYAVRTWADFDRVVPAVLPLNEPTLIEVFIDPEQAFVPRMAPVRLPDGTMGSPDFDTLTPPL